MDYAALAVHLVRLDFETGQTKTVRSVGTGFAGAPGHIILSDSTGMNTKINNRKYSWFLRFAVELQSPLFKDELRLYGVRIAYK